ncbi:sensor domain-containing protein [Gellertiella hungarica]|uniref:Diguanylate cyclase (GGDEF)-like protein/PAS domain S-box-containing protein n=1 Tax=Gellertiella hungarica TaxID=1572859 RepID=A0A7W6J4J7_9HYPH|nr:bifunctional diguanylate cyclase/phosphodiesterase [Gellertiella hungarica]MBB4064648.1 diguanylate cyclase (GGDEF)-like protein/PAS domain S-box-containing protein [Gellertiella hungarica]
MSPKPLFFKGNQADPTPAEAEERWRDYQFEYCLVTLGTDARVLGVLSSDNCPFAIDQGAAIGRPLAELIHPHDQPVLLRMISESARRPDVPFHAQVRFGTRDLHHWVLVIFGARASGSSDRVEVQLVPTRTPSDVLDDLVERESRWNHALVGSDLGVWDHNFRTGSYYYSDVWKSLRGIPVEEEVNPNFDDWIRNIHPDDQARVIEAVAGQNAGDERYQVFEYRERHREGHFIWIECRGSVVEWDQDGTPLRVVGTDTDITKRKEDEARLEKLSQRLEMALDVSQIGVFEADLETGPADWDDNVLKIFGLEGTEHLKPFSVWESMILPEDRARAVDVADTGAEDKKPFRNEYRIRRPDGSVRYIRARAAPFRTSSGVNRMIGANWDVTEDVLLRQELAAAKDLAEARNKELEEVHARIRHNALHDYLTGLPNRRYLEEILERETALGAKDRRPLSVLHIDLNRFKQINDTLGHEAGDVVLKEATTVLRGLVRGNDFVARIGGDEFAFVSRSLNTPRRLAALADQIIRELSKPVPYHGHAIRIGASIGIAIAEGEKIDGKQLLLNADIALYRAKSRGRNRHEFFSPETQDAIIRTKRLSDEILHALENREFIPFYQPQFFADDLRLAGMETLVRWKHPERGIITPDQFLSVATDLDVVSTIDAFVLEQALSDLNRWERDGLAIDRISVNVSARRLDDPQLIRKLKSLKIRPGTVSFELLESIFLDDHDKGTADTLAALRSLGIQIEIDDFGTGHASIISLMKINPHILKIDRELVRSLPDSTEQRRLVASIVEIGKSLDIKVLAEGVETREHIRILKDVGCDILQGYGLARPMPADAIPNFIREKRWMG